MEIKLPHNERLEKFVLSAAINHNLATLEVLESCDDSDFIKEKHKIVFACLKTLFKQTNSITLNSLLFEISKQDKREVIDRDDITSIAFDYWAGMPYSEYIKELKNVTCLRRAIYAAQDLLLSASRDGANSDEVISEHQNKLLSAQGADGKKVVSAKEISEKFNSDRNFNQDVFWRCGRFKQGLPTYEGISSGYPLLDQTLGSFQNGYIYTIGARTSMGKTTFMLNLIRNMLKKHRVGIFSLEMSSPILYAKLACLEAKVRYRDFYDGNIPSEKQRVLLNIENDFSKAPLFIDDESSVTINKLVSKAKRLKYSHKIDILFIDYLTRIKSTGKYTNKHLEIDEITKGIQALAKTLQIPIIMLAQLNRQTITATKTRPSMIDFKESGSIEEDSDACLLLHRPDYYKADEKPGSIEVIVDKNRIMGTRRTIEFHCDSKESELYIELNDISEEIKKANEAGQSKIEMLSWAARFGDDED